MRRLVMICAVVVLAVGATPSAGGWVVTTVDDLPEYFVAGEPTTLTFTIRQHGTSRMRGRSPSVRVRDADAGFFNRGQRFRAEAAGPALPGTYRVVVRVDQVSTVDVTIDADFNGQESRLLPMPVVADSARPAALTGVERGRQLFVGKGCYSCHVVEDDPEVYERNRVHVGPDLTGRQFPVEYLIAKLADPRTGRSGISGDLVMPDLELDDQEISALVRYLNRSGASTAVR